MPPRRAASFPQPPVVRRPRIPRACHFCRVAKQRCESTEFGSTDQPCRRCVSQGLLCSLPRTTRSQSRSQSPSAGPSLPGSILHSTLQSGGSTPGERTLGSGNDVRHPLMPPELVRIQGSTANIPLPGENPLQMSNFPPFIPSMDVTPSRDVYQQDLRAGSLGVFLPSNNTVIQSSNLAPGYYGYYMADYLPENTSDGERDFSYATDEDSQPGHASNSTHEQVVNFFRPGES